MMSFLVYFFVAAISACTQAEEILIDRLYDMDTTPGWSYTCNNGYQTNVTDFRCGLLGIRVNIPEEHLNGEIGFWTGCGSVCHLKYAVATNDTGFSFRAFFQDTHMLVIKNEEVQEEVSGANWTITEVDLHFTQTIELRLEQIRRNVFVVIDKIFISKQEPTPTTRPTTTRTTTTPTTTTTWTPESPTPSTTTPMTTTITTTTPTTTTPTTTTPTTTPTTTTPTTTTPTTTPTTTTPTTTTPTTTPTTTTPTTTTPTTTTPTTTTPTPTTTTPTTTTPTPTTTTTTPTTTTPTTTTPTTTTPTTTTRPTTTSIRPTTTTPTTTTRPTTTSIRPTTTTGPREVVIDVEEDIPDNGRWNLTCPGGYKLNTTYYNCSDGGEVNFPVADLNDEIGFWTQCTLPCRINYEIQAEDTLTIVRAYHRSRWVRICLDDTECKQGNVPGWQEIQINLAGKKKLSIELFHSGPELFAVLDKITIR